MARNLVTHMTRADSKGEEPREEIILPSLGSGVKKVIVAEDDQLNVGSFEDKHKAVSLHYLERKLVSVIQIREDLETNATFHRIFISVSSASLVSVSFKMSLYVEAMYQVSMNTSYTAMVNPGAPQYFKFMWPTAEDDMAILAVDSNDSFCMTVSVQNLTCPLNDLNSNVDFEGIYQTVDTKTGMSVRPGGAGADMTELSLARTSAPASCPGPGEC